MSVIEGSPWGTVGGITERHVYHETPEGASITSYQDCLECALALADQQPRRGYAREGQPARIDVPDPHIRMNMISTISNQGSVHFMTYKQTMTAALFITFLERLLGETTRKVFLIVDRLKAHEAKKVEAWAA